MHGTKTVPYTARSKRAGLGRVEGGCCGGKTRGLHDELYYKFARQMDYVCVYAVCNLRTTRVIHTRSNYYIQEGKAEIRPIVRFSRLSSICRWTLSYSSYSDHIPAY